MSGWSRDHRILVIDPDPALAQALAGALAKKGATARGEVPAAALAALGQFSPAVVITPVPDDKNGIARILRVIRDDYMGVPPRLVGVSRHARSAPPREFAFDVLLVPSARPDAMLAACAPEPWPDPAPSAMLELVRTTLLGGEFADMVAGAAKRLALATGARECVIVAGIGDRQVIRSAHEAPPASDAPLWDLAHLSLTSGAEVLGALAGEPASVNALPIAAEHGHELGAIVLLGERPRGISPVVVDGVRALGPRLAAEIGWSGLQERLAVDNERLRQIAMLDPVLGVWTRAALEQSLPGELGAAQRRGEPVTIAAINLRGLRHINEAFGHAVGDTALQVLANVIRTTLRAQDLVARWAGDAFVVVMAGAPPAAARGALERLLKAVQDASFDHEDRRVELSASVAIAPLGGDDDSGDAAVARALAALASGKESGETLVIAAPGAPLPQPAASLGLEAGATVGGVYQIRHEISRGAMGVVYRAEDLGLGRQVALKTLRQDLARDRSFVERFRGEAAMLAAIRHEHLVQVYAFGQDGDHVYFVMELVEGEPLEDRIERACHDDVPLPPALLVQVVSQIGDALDAMHKAGVLHRDVKPANVLLDRVRERAVLVDVGIAKRRTASYDPAGTPGFTAPEAFTGGGAEGPSTDAYGLGATAYAMLTGAAAFGDGDGQEILQRQLTGAITPPSHYRPELAGEIEAVLLRALDPDPTRRFASCGELALALATSLHHLDGVVVEGAMDHLKTERLGEPSTKPGPRRAPAPTSAPVPVPAATSSSSPPPLPASVHAAQGSGAPPIPAPAVERSQAMARPRPSGAVIDRLQAGGAAARGEGDRPVQPHTRGVLLRSALRVLGARQGAAWASALNKADPELAAVFHPQHASTKWHPSPLFWRLFQRVAESGRNAGSFAHELGRVTAGATFSRLFGAEPAMLTPAEIMAAAETVFGAYHTWGVVNVASSPGQAVITISGATAAGVPPHPLSWLHVAGLFEEVARMTGALSADTQVALLEDGAQIAVEWQIPSK